MRRPDDVVRRCVRVHANGPDALWGMRHGLAICAARSARAGCVRRRAASGEVMCREQAAPISGQDPVQLRDLRECMPVVAARVLHGHV